MKRTAIMQIIYTSLALAIATNLWAAPIPDRQWYRMCSPHFDILFPADFSREAKRVANTLEHLYEPVAQSLCIQPRRISVILRTHKAKANGFVALAPRRVELFTFPTQDYNFLHTNDWLSLLAVHELRHVAQYEQFTQRFSKLLYRLGGESLLMGYFFGSIPPWCLEGDAIGIETALTKGGRGRIPQFGLLYKANLLERGSFSYQKQIFGSYKHLVPDYYKVGYYVTTHLRRKHGADVLASILRQTIISFPRAVQKVTGRSLYKVYQDTNQELWDHWHGQLKDLKATPVQRLNARSNSAVYTDYSYPQVCEAGIIALKSGIATPAQFILLDTQQKEHPIFIPGNIDQEVGFSVAQGKLVWVEHIPDLRWEDRSYSVIQLYDNKAKQLKTLTPKGRYGAASLSPDATKIVALASDECYNHQLVMLDAEQGQVLCYFPNPDNHYYLTPRWSADGQHIVAVKHANQQATITLINASTGNSQDILPYSAENIGCPVMAGQYVFYNSAYNGIDNIYAIDLQTKRRYQVTSRRYGAYNPTMATDGQWLILNDFTKDGMDVVRMPFDPQQWISLEEVEDRTVRYYEPLVAQENNCDLLKHIPNRTYPIKSYQPWKHLVNIHSWGLDSSAYEEEPLRILNHVMLSITSQDLLNTASLKAGYEHDFTGKAGKFLTKFTYKGWYPIIDVGGSFKKNYCHHYIRNKKALNLEAKLPLTWMHGQYTHKLSLSCLANIISLSQQVRLNQQVRSNAYIQMYGANLSRTSKKSLRDIHSPWAQMLKLHYGHIPYKAARQFWATKVRLCFPSLLQHHSLQVSMGYQYNKLFPYYLSDVLPRGFQYKDAEDLYTTSLDYIFPIWYPDWSYGSLLYIKRLKAHAFYDMAYEQPYLHGESNQFFHSLGLALSLDIHSPIPLEIGINYTYLPGSRNYSFAPVFRFS